MSLPLQKFKCTKIKINEIDIEFFTELLEVYEKTLDNIEMDDLSKAIRKAVISSYRTKISSIKWTDEEYL